MTMCNHRERHNRSDRNLAWLGGLILTGLWVGGCGDQPLTWKGPTGGSRGEAEGVFIVAEGTTLKLAFITNNASEFWNIARKGLEKAEKELGIRVDFKAPPQQEVKIQNQYLEDLLVQGYHGIAISPIAAADQVREIDRAAAQLNIITQDSDSPKSKRLSYIGTNNFQAGKTLGEQIVRLLPTGGKIAVFVGTFSADNADARFRGIKEAIAGKNIQVVAQKEDNKQEVVAKTNVEDVLNAISDIDMLVGLWAYNGPAIVSALKGSGKAGKVKCVCFDEEDGTLAGIQDGTVECTVVQKPFELGYQSAKLLRELCYKGESALPKDRQIDTGIDVIDKSNVAAFKAKLAELKK